LCLLPGWVLRRRTEIFRATKPAAVPAGFFIGIYMELDFAKQDGLIPAVIQDANTGRVLMVGFMNDEAWKKTLETGCAVFYSRSRKKLWLKGETSGHKLMVKEITTDCDQDTLVLKVDPIGPGVCHNGYESCFYRRWENGGWVVTDKQTFDVDKVYGS